MEHFRSVSCGQTHNMECVSVTAVYLWENRWSYWSVSDKTHTPGDFIMQTPKKYKHTLMFHHLSCIPPAHTYTHTHTHSKGLIVIHLTHTHTKNTTPDQRPLPFFDISLMGPSAPCVLVDRQEGTSKWAVFTLQHSNECWHARTRTHTHTHLYQNSVSMLFVYSLNLCVSTAIVKIWVWIFTGFTIQFNDYYHYQLNFTMRHIISFQYYCIWLHFHINLYQINFCAKFTLLLYKQATYFK